ncbi:glycosyltransferase [Faecalicatena contorta]|uniref:glycosyltransferase n=1 Tax=Faecalicatena contorta TaxID=39482 RepID=UPI001F3DD2D2|nr:glycosyltransferase [Faecalicatena contorta]MCF2555880.1 glycosyltransferase [Faecalicatena contorta]
MKILFLSAANSVHTEKWVNSFAERNCEIHLVYNPDHSPRTGALNPNVQLHPLKYSGMKGYYFNAPELKRIVACIAPDIINVHYASGYGTLARMARIPSYLLSVWGSDVYDFPKQNKLKEKILIRNVKYATKLASTSNCMADELRKIMKDEKLDITITPFGVDLKNFDAEKYPKEQKEYLLIGTIKALEEIYRIKDLIMGIDALLKHLGSQYKHPKDIIRVEIYGEGSQKQELIDLTYRLGLNEVICFKGSIPNTEVPQIMNRFDIFCVTSQRESFGVAVVEAMAMKKPVVATDAEGFKEVMVQEKTGIIVRAGDTDAIGKALNKLISNPELREYYGENGRKRVEELYVWEKNVDIMENLYKKMITV